MALKDERIMVKVTSDEKDLISEITKERDIPVSQFIREAVREKIADLRAKQEKQEAAVN